MVQTSGVSGSQGPTPSGGSGGQLPKLPPLQPSDPFVALYRKWFPDDPNYLEDAAIFKSNMTNMFNSEIGRCAKRQHEEALREQAMLQGKRPY